MRETLLTMEDHNDSNGDNDAASNLDHALLESLFYNEMLMMDMDDPTEQVLAAPDILSLPAVASTQAHSEPPAMHDMACALNVNGSVQNSAPAGPQYTIQGSPAAAPSHSFAAPVPTGASAPPATQSMPLPGQPAVAPMSRMPVTTNIPGQSVQNAGSVSQERAAQLVSQFATLASRLGISLPPNVLSSLTAAAAANEAQSIGTATMPLAPMAPVAAAPDSTLSSVPVPPPSDDPPKVKELESTAEAAIASVNESRKRKEESPTASTGSRPLYSKRRKKPRLSDCEAKLAELRSENEMLKRHLANVTNKAQVFDQERARATQEMKRMLQEGAPPEKLNPLLHKYGETYADYGRHRHQELTFHLDQLEKLVAPTTFTKMGLWTLGQNEGFYTNPKRNPIAGILMKELDITPAQGRRILEQRQRIQDVCDNLKQCLVLLGKLKDICEHKQKIFHDRMSKCQEILTPIQVVKLLLWVDEHSQLLESVCPGWGSERIQEAKPKPT